MNLSMIYIALGIIAAYFAVNLLIALAWGIKWLSQIPERRHREMVRYFDRLDEQFRKEVNSDRLPADRPCHRDGKSSG